MSEPSPPPTAAARVIACVRAVAAAGAQVEVFGSSVYAPAYAEDVDVLVSDDDPGRLAGALGLAALPTTPPRLHGVLDGVRVDVTVVRGDDEPARRFRSGPRDAAALAAALAAHGRDEVFQAHNERLQERLAGSVWSQCRSWYRMDGEGRIVNFWTGCGGSAAQLFEARKGATVLLQPARAN